MPELGLLQFEPLLVERLWGGTRLGVPAREGKTPIGESWLISDHSSHASVVSHGRHRGSTLRQLVETYPRELLGTVPRLTPDGRFPLLLKLIDAAQALSVQVHPDDDAAKRLGEPDVGKTECWHVLDASPGAVLYCGLKPGVDRPQFETAAREGGVASLLEEARAEPGLTLLIPAGTIHAIGAGVLVAEIQQNSDITYRLYDWDRLDAHGNPRALHLEKGLQVADFSSRPSAQATSIPSEAHASQHLVLATCPYFSVEELRIEGTERIPTHGDSFNILLAKHGHCKIASGTHAVEIAPRQCVLAPAALEELTLTGTQAQVLHFYVPHN